MARVLLIANAVVNFTKYSFDSLYQGVINALTRSGNDVFFLKANLFLDQDKNVQNLQINIKKNKFIRYIKDIEPELIISVNNNITKEILDNTDCPVVFWSSESYDFLVSKDLIAKYQSRYLFLHFDESVRKQFLDNISLDAKKNIVTFLSTDVQAKRLKQDKNISFLGTIHGTDNEFNEIKKYIVTKEKRQQILELLKKIKADPLKSIGLAKTKPKVTKTSLMNILSKYQRLTTLDALSDLGLHVYGGQKWLKIFDSFPFLSLAYRYGLICSLDEVSNLYNSSKISINVPHIHSESFLSYRCPDILASNAVLLNKGKINAHYDPKGIIPYFNSPLEARELTKKLLNNPNQRKDIVSYCHEIVEENLRFEHRIKEIEEILSLKLFNLVQKQGKYIFIEPDDFTSLLWTVASSASNSIVNFLPTSATNLAYKFALPFSRIIPEDIKRIYRDRR